MSTAHCLVRRNWELECWESRSPRCKLYQLLLSQSENVRVCFCSTTASLVSPSEVSDSPAPGTWGCLVAVAQEWQVCGPLALSGGALSSVRNSCLVQPDKKTEGNAWLSSPSRNPMSTAAVRKTTWDCPLKNKEPEQKLYKKPNLVVKPLQLVSGVQGLDIVVRITEWMFKSECS